MNYLLILNDPPYGTERSYNALRLGLSLRRREGVTLKLFLLGDAVACAKAGQKTPEGAYNLERMLKGSPHMVNVFVRTTLSSWPPGVEE